jgi:hypothetical protein
MLIYYYYHLFDIGTYKCHKHLQFHIRLWPMRREVINIMADQSIRRRLSIIIFIGVFIMMDDRVSGTSTWVIIAGKAPISTRMGGIDKKVGVLTCERCKWIFAHFPKRRELKKWVWVFCWAQRVPLTHNNIDITSKEHMLIMHSFNTCAVEVWENKQLTAFCSR